MLYIILLTLRGGVRIIIIMIIINIFANIYTNEHLPRATQSPIITTATHEDDEK